MPAEVTLDVSAAALESFATDPAGPVMLHMLGVAGRVEELARKRAPKGSTGDLENSIGITPPIVAAGRIEVGVEATAPYAYWVHEGSRPHDIVPRTAHVLAWEGPEGPVFARRTHHPGTKANPFLAEALAEGVV